MGRHPPLPSGSLQQAPIPTSATRAAVTRSKTGYNSSICKKVTTPKTYKNEKTENYNSEEGERKKPQKISKVIRRFSASRKKDFKLLMLKMMQDIENKLEVEFPSWLSS